ncbi:MAG: PAS domain S-box protein [Pyrinomonadaceae bacterium]
MKISDPDLKIERRAKQLFEVQRRSVYKDTDRMFAFLMAIQWAVGVIAALVLTPKSWVGTTSAVSDNVWGAVFLGGAISSFPIALAFLHPGKAVTRFTIAVAQMLMASLLIHISGGRIETHFHIFGSLAFLSFYRDWRILIPATLTVAADHLLRGLFWPQSIYGLMTIDEWRWVEHAGWVVFEDIFLIIAIKRSVTEMWNIAMRSAAIRDLNESLEVRVHERTAELANSNASLEIEVEHRRRLHAESQIASEMAHFSSRSRDGHELLGFADRLTGEVLRADRFYVALADPNTDVLRMSYYRDSEGRPPGKSDLEGGLARLAAKAGRPRLFDRLGISRAMESGDVVCEEPLPASWLGVPISSPKKVIGVLVAERQKGEIFTSDDARLLTLVCHQIALSIERKEAEDFRRESEERFQDLFDNAPIAYHEIDREGRYVRVNRTEERLLGYTSEELKGRHVSDLIVGKNARAAIMDKMEGRGKLQSVELKFIRKDGRRISVLTEDRLIRDESGDVTGIRTTLQDITALKILEEQVMRGQKLESIGQLAAGIAHEINTPTQFVGDNVRFLRDSFRGLPLGR